MTKEDLDGKTFSDPIVLINENGDTLEIFSNEEVAAKHAWASPFGAIFNGRTMFFKTMKSLNNKVNKISEEFGLVESL